MYKQLELPFFYATRIGPPIRTDRVNVLLRQTHVSYLVWSVRVMMSTGTMPEYSDYLGECFKDELKLKKWRDNVKEQ
jgi:hypothetical protein